MKEFIKKFVTNDNEFSKRFTKSIRNFMFIHVSVCLFACIIMAFAGVDYEGMLMTLESMMPVYIALQGANYVKSGFENVQKIIQSKTEEDSEDG